MTLMPKVGSEINNDKKKINRVSKEIKKEGREKRTEAVKESVEEWRERKDTAKKKQYSKTKELPNVLGKDDAQTQNERLNAVTKILP